MIEKLKTAFWFARQPAFWPHATSLAIRKITPSPEPGRDGEAARWAEDLAVPLDEALTKLGILAPGQTSPAFPEADYNEAKALVDQAPVRMGGAGHYDMLYAAVRLIGAERVVETGVAYGWSSMALLSALDAQGKGKLVSVDMPYAKVGGEKYVGVAVPERLRPRWQLLRLPDRNGLAKAIALLGGTIDLAHYDSDKSYAGRMFGYPRIWAALRPGGVFISDDVGDNFGFRDFFQSRGAAFQITPGPSGQSVGIAVKR